MIDEAGCNFLSSLFCKDKQTGKTPNRALGKEWDGEMSYPISKAQSFARIYSMVQKLSVFADFSKGNKNQPVSGIIQG